MKCSNNCVFETYFVCVLKRVCMCVFIKLHITGNPALLYYSSNATCMKLPSGGSVICDDKMCACACVCLCVCVRARVNLSSRVSGNVSYVSYANEMFKEG